jgi:hypothetical protein
MPQELKNLRKLYSSLDFNDLEFLKHKAELTPQERKVREKALFFAYGDKSEDTEKVRQQWENRYVGREQTDELVEKYGDFDDSDL